MRTKFVLLLFAAILFVLTNATTEYPELKLAEARCPEVHTDHDDWHLTDFDNNLRCLSPIFVDKVNSLTPNELEERCRLKHRDAVPTVLSPAENKYLTLSLNGNGLYQVCTVAAFPRDYVEYKRAYNERHSSLREPPKYVDRSQYYCEGEGWTLATPCNATASCYKLVDIRNKSFGKQSAVEINYCGMVEPNSFAASGHCAAEYAFLAQTEMANVQIGLFIPHYGVWNKFDSWQWSDKSTLDYIPWELGAPTNYDNGKTRVAQVNRNGNLIDVPVDSGHYVYCKKAAMKVYVPLDVQRWKARECRIEKPTQYNHRCPPGTDKWHLVESEEGIHCFGFVSKPFLPADFGHEICAELHPVAKLASIHNDLQLGHILSLPRAGSVIVGMECENDNNCQWMDKSSVNVNYYSPTLAFHNFPNSLITTKIVDMQTSCRGKACPQTIINRPLFDKEYYFSVLNKKVVCKIDAEPVAPCAPMPITTGIDSYQNKDCEEGWIRKRFCDFIFCYKLVDLPPHQQNYEAVYENNVCGAEAENAQLASIHCLEEHYFVQGFPEGTAIGLHIPKNARFSDNYFDVRDFQWTDGSVVDFVGWNRNSKSLSADGLQDPLFPRTNIEHPGRPGFFVFNKYCGLRSGWTNVNNGLQRVLCKKRASWTKTDFAAEIAKLN